MTPHPYAHIFLPATDPSGKPVFSVVAKASFTITPEGRCIPSEEPPQLQAADKFFDPGDALTCACEVESDLMPWKLMTDVIVIGKARAPRNKEVIQMGCSVSVGNHRKSIVAFGDRKVLWKPLVGPVFSEAQPFTEMDIRYERAYGGVDIHVSETPYVYARNPIGYGFVVKKKKEALDGMKLPNFEDPNTMLTPEGIAAVEIADWHRMPMPAGFGVFGKAWYPRMSFAGVMPADMPLYEQTHEMTLGLVPKDQVATYKSLKQPMMNFKFFNGASPGLAVPYLTGTEMVKIEGMTIDGMLQFQLPGGKPRISIDYGEGVKETEVVLHTAVIRTEPRTVDLSWRGACEYPGPQMLEKIKKLDIRVEA